MSLIHTDPVITSLIISLKQVRKCQQRFMCQNTHCNVTVAKYWEKIMLAMRNLLRVHQHDSQRSGRLMSSKGENCPEQFPLNLPDKRTSKKIPLKMWTGLHVKQNQRKEVENIKEMHENVPLRIQDYRGFLFCLHAMLYSYLQLTSKPWSQKTTVSVSLQINPRLSSPLPLTSERGYQQATVGLNKTMLAEHSGLL